MVRVRVRASTLAFMLENKVLAMFTLKLIVSLMIVRTTEFVPDEHWQSSEVAHRFHFGTGHLTWEWVEGIRCVLVPCLLQGWYWLGSHFNCVSPWFLSFFPELGVAVMTLISMQYFYKYLLVRYGDQLADLSMRLIAINWFTTFCGARLIANQMEMNLNCIGLYLLDQKGLCARIMLAILTGINFMTRPTMGIFWYPFVDILVIQLLLSGTKKFTVIASIFGALTILAIGLLDSLFYGRFISTAWKFFSFNFLDRGNAEFGESDGFWYILVGLPSIFGPLAFFIWGLGIGYAEDIFELLFKLSMSMVAYSSLDHKEIRFILPCVPICCVILAEVFVNLEFQMRSGPVWGFYMSKAAKRKAFKWSFIIANLVATWFFGFHHQKGIKPAANFIHEKMNDVVFPRTWLMMPCYSVPAFTYLHHPEADLKFYVCSPKRFHYYLNKDEGNFVQLNGFETVDILADVDQKLEQSFPPHFIMTYGKVASTVQYAFRRRGYYYVECARYRHTYVGDFHRFVVVLCALPFNLHGGTLGGHFKGS